MINKKGQRRLLGLCFITACALFICSDTLLCQSSNILSEIKTTYTNIVEFTYYSCIPCHYDNKGTNLIETLKGMSEEDIFKYVQDSIINRHMPPDPSLRAVLREKLGLIKKPYQKSRSSTRLNRLLCLVNGPR